MKTTQEEVNEILDRRLQEDKVRQMTLMEQAAVDKEKLTSDPRWNIFLQEIQARINKAEKDLASLKEKYVSPLLTDPNETTLIKNKVLMLAQEIDTLNYVISLPKQIIQNGKVAKGFLAKLQS